MRYRKNVAAIVLKNNKVLLVHNKDHGPSFWKFPQGGVEKGETEKEAICRELKEELGTDDFRFLFKSKIEHQYDWPPEIQREKGFRGQRQTFWIFEYKNKKSFDLLKGDLDDFKWINLERLPGQFKLPDMKKNARKLIAEIKGRTKIRRAET